MTQGTKYIEEVLIPTLEEEIELVKGEGDRKARNEANKADTGNDR